MTFVIFARVDRNVVVTDRVSLGAWGLQGYVSRRLAEEAHCVSASSCAAALRRLAAAQPRRQEAPDGFCIPLWVDH